MSTKKIRMHPEGGNDYQTVLHPETSADMVKFSDGSTVEAHMNNVSDKIGTPGPKASNLNLDSVFEAWDWLVAYLEENPTVGIVDKIGNPGDNTPSTLFGAIKSSATALAQIVTTPNGNVTVSQGSKSYTKKADSLGIAEFELSLGFWDVVAEVNYKVLIEQTGKLYTLSAGDKLKLNDLSWGLIDLLARQGLAPQFFSLGDTKEITIKGEKVEMQIIGFNHDDLSPSGKAKITFQSVNSLEQGRRIEATATNTNSWNGSEMRSWMQGELFNSLPTDLSKVIKSVKKKTAAAGNNTSIITTTDKLFLLSEIEVFGTRTTSHAGEGAKYPIFTDVQSRFKKGGGNYNYWWTRSPSNYTSNPTFNFVLVQNNGTANAGSAAATCGVAFGFCI